MKISELIPFTVRMPPALKEKIKGAAKTNLGGSANSEIIRRLEESFGVRKELSDFTDAELIGELIRRYGRDGIFILVGKRKEEAEGAIAAAVEALQEKLAEEIDHAEEAAKQRRPNR